MMRVMYSAVKPTATSASMSRQPGHDAIAGSDWRTKQRVETRIAPRMSYTQQGVLSQKASSQRHVGRLGSYCAPVGSVTLDVLVASLPTWWRILLLTQCTTSAARDEDGRLSRSWIAARCVGARMSELVATALVSGGVRLESGALRSGAPTYSPVDMANRGNNFEVRKPCAGVCNFQAAYSYCIIVE